MIFGLVAGGIAALGYVINVWLLVTQPCDGKSLTPWIIWSVVGALLFKSYLTVGGSADETNDSAWVLMVYAIGPPTVLSILFLHSKIRRSPFTRLDKLFLAASVFSSVYLGCFNEGVLPLHINAAIDASGGVLLGRHVWRDPHSESLLVWSLFGLAGILNLFAVQSWSYMHGMYPVVLAAMTASLSVVIAIRRRGTPRPSHVS